jgi:hypothetical protein
VKLVRPLALSLVLLLAGASGPSAGETDPDASRSPRVSGPLLGFPFDCEDNGPADPGETRGQSCTWSYELAPIETDVEHDFSAYWVQMEIEPSKGSCALELIFDLELPDSATLISATHEKNRRIKKNTEQLSRLLVDGGGTAPVPGTIEQDVAVPKGREKIKMRERGYRYRWIGRSRDKVVVAIGLQIAHRSTPPEFFYTTSEGHGMGWGSCRPYIIEAGAEEVTTSGREIATGLQRSRRLESPS